MGGSAVGDLPDGSRRAAFIAKRCQLLLPMIASLKELSY
ncbi:MAG: hypothetical protein RLZZ458_3275, partial [Planctomycetota bacterium]